jgi:TPR repeat protein
MQLLKFDKAIPWLEKNANNGDVNAYYLLAEAYCNEEKFKDAKKWAQKSIDNGNSDAVELYKKFNLDKY